MLKAKEEEGNLIQIKYPVCCKMLLLFTVSATLVQREVF
jgi:hypothetical protein